MRPRVLAGLLLALLLGAGLGWLARNRAPTFVQPVPAGAATAAQALFELELVDLQGRRQTLAAWRGQPLLINFWASWCGPCREEMPLFAELARQPAGQGLQVLGIAWESLESAQAFAAQNPANYPLLVARNGLRDILAGLGNPAGGLPFTLLLDADGRPQAVKLGAFRGDELQRWLRDHAVANGRKMK